MRIAADPAPAPAASLRAAEPFTVIAIFAAALMHWLVLNDVHMNPYDRTQGSPYAQDTNPWLFAQSVDAMRKAVPDASVIVLGGDLLAHHFPALARDAHENPYRAGVRTVSSIARALDRAFPHAQFLVAVGNNDDPCGDYRSETGGGYQRAVAEALAPLVNRHGAAPGFAAGYERGGYYTASLPGGMRAVVVNSVLWSFVYRGSCQNRTHDPSDAEMSWLRPLLAQGENVLVMHIPPGFDPESTTIAHRVLAVPFLAPRYDGELRALLSADRTHVAFALAGHTHRYDFRTPGVPMLVASSLSPVYRNSPAFFRLDVAGDELRDVTPYTFDRWSGEWIERPSFDATYGVSSFSHADLVSLSDRIADDPSMRARWNEAYDVWSRRMGDVSDHRWQTFRCAEVAFGAAYGRCAGTTRRSWAVVIAAAVLAALLAAALVVGFRRRARPAS